MNAMPPQLESDVTPSRDSRTVWLIAATATAVLICLLITFLLLRAIFPGGESMPAIAWGTLTPTAEPADETPTPVSTASACEPDAEYVADVTIPDDTAVSPGETFLKAWRVRNSGTCSWSPAYMLRFTGGDSMGAATTVPIPAAAPGETAELSTSLTAPTDPGTYRGDWRICAEDSTCFGPRLYVQIVVEAAPTLEPTTVAGPTVPPPTEAVATAAPVTSTPTPDDATSTPLTPDAGASAWLTDGGRRLGVREIAWDTALNGYVVDEGSIYLSLYIVAETTTESSATFNGLEISVVDGEGGVHTTLIIERKDPPFGLCIARPAEPCEGWWTTMLPDRPSARGNLVLRWEPRVFAPFLETPIK
jgi:hypothetical protein